MPIQRLNCSDELQPFFNELPMPNGLNGNEQSLNSFPIGQSFALNVSAMEVFRDFQLMGWLRLSSIDQIGCVWLDCRLRFDKRQFWRGG